MIALLFWLLTALACGYAAIYGGAQGRWAACMIIVACLLTVPASFIGPRFGRFEPAVFGVDLALLIGFYVLALATFGFIVSVARAHHPLGSLVLLNA